MPILLIRMQRLIRQNILSQVPSNSGKDSFIHLFIQSLFISWDIWLNNSGSMLARNSKFDIRICEVFLVFIMIRRGRKHPTAFHSYQRDGVRGGGGKILFFSHITLIFFLYNFYFNEKVLYYNLTNQINKISTKYNGMFLDKLESYIFQDFFSSSLITSIINFFFQCTYSFILCFGSY